MEQIDYIFDMLEWNNSLEEQARGIELAKSIENFGKQEVSKKNEKF